MKTWILKAVIISTICIFSSSALAYAQCGPRKLIVEQLKKKYQETRGGMGLSNGILFEVWAAKSTGSFTILTTTPRRISCIIVAGKNWEFTPQVKEDTPGF